MMISKRIIPKFKNTLCLCLIVALFAGVFTACTIESEIMDAQQDSEDRYLEHINRLMDSGLTRKEAEMEIEIKQKMNTDKISYEAAKEKLIEEEKAREERKWKYTEFRYYTEFKSNGYDEEKAKSWAKITTHMDRYNVSWEEAEEAIDKADPDNNTVSGGWLDIIIDDQDPTN